MAGTYKNITGGVTPRKLTGAASTAMKKAPAKMPAWNAAAPKAAPKAAPAAPQAATPTVAAAQAAAASSTPVKPIWTQDQIQNKINFDSQYKDDASGKGTVITDLDQQLRDAGITQGYNKTVNERNAVVGQSSNNDEMAARGLVQSSVRDAASYDIEAQRALQSGMIDQQFTSIRDAVNAKLQAIKDMRTTFGASYNEQGAQGGRAAESAVIPDAPAPAPAAAPAAAKPNTAALIQQWKDRPYTESEGTNSKGQHGVWHHYKDGRTVFVAR